MRGDADGWKRGGGVFFSCVGGALEAAEGIDARMKRDGRKYVLVHGPYYCYCNLYSRIILAPCNFHLYQTEDFLSRAIDVSWQPKYRIPPAHHQWPTNY